MATETKEQPPAIKAALSVLDIIREEDQARYEALKKALPALAMQLAKAGEEITKETLLAHVRQGDDHLAALKEKHSHRKGNHMVLTYETVVKNFPSPPQPPTTLNERFVKAASDGDMVAMLKAIADGADVRARSDDALAGACVHGHLEIVRELIKHGADIHINLDYPLRGAAEFGHLEVVRELLKHGANIRLGTGGGTPSLSFSRATEPAEPLEYKGYTDSKGQYVIASGITFK